MKCQAEGCKKKGKYYPKSKVTFCKNHAEFYAKDFRIKKGGKNG